MSDSPTPASLPQYRVTRSVRKTLALHVRDQRVEVRSPLQVSEAAIDAFVLQHQQWIQRMLQQQAQRATQRPLLQQGGRLFYKGRDTVVHVRESRGAAVQVYPEGILIRTPSLQQAQIHAVVRSWLMAEAREVLMPRTHALAGHLGLAEKLHEVVLRKTRSKWGHCTAGGRIQYNWLIMLAPDAVIDYMICHEVSHLVHMNHSPEFWRLVASLCPQHQSCRQWLRKHGHRLWFD